MKLNWKYLVVGASVLLVACQKPMEQSGDEMQNNTMTSQEMMKKEEKMMEHKMVDASFTDLDGNQHSLADYRGKKVYLKFWASWCPICLAGLADIDQLASQVPEDAVVLSVVAPGVNNEKSLEDFKKWYSELEYKNLPVLVDSQGAFLKQLGVVGYPTSAFINANGELVRVQPGHLASEEIQATLETL